MPSLLVAAVVTLRLTLPSFQPGGVDAMGNPMDRCAPSIVPLRDLRGLRLYAEDQVVGPRWVLELEVGGLEGQSLLLQVEVDTSRAVMLFATTTDSAGNESCFGNRLLLGPPPLVSAPAPGPACGDTAWYDLAGRRVRRPRWSGIYFWRCGDRRGHRLVLR